MNNKESILENVDQYNADQLVEFIRQGIVSLEELKRDTDGRFTPSKRREVSSTKKMYTLERKQMYIPKRKQMYT